MVRTQPLPAVTRRLLLGLIVSLVAHAAIVLVIAPKSSYERYAPQTSLEIEIRHVAAAQDAVAVVHEPSVEVSVQPVVPQTTREALRHDPEPQVSAIEAPITLPLPLGNKYYTGREVDVRAEPINEVHLVYPQEAYQRRISGKVQLRLFINENGAIDEISLVSATPPGTFEQAALDATLALQFSPAIRKGRNVKSQKTIEVVFDPYESINIP